MYHLMIEIPLKENEDDIGVVADNLEFCKSVVSEMEHDVKDALLFSIRRNSTIRDYTPIFGVPEARLCSERFIQILHELGVFYRSYPARIMNKKKRQVGRDIFMVVPQIKIDAIDWERSEVHWINANRKHLTKIVLKPLSDEIHNLLFYPKELTNCFIIHDILMEHLESARLRGVGFAPLDAVANPLAGVERLEIEKQLQLEPANLSLWLRLSVLYTSTFRIQDALKVTEHVLSLDPNNLAALHACGAHLYSLGKLEAALDMYSKEVEIDQSGRGWWECCTILRQLGRVDEALIICKKYVFQNPWIISRRSWYELGVSYIAVENLQEALAALNQALTLPGEPREVIYLAKGSLLLTLQQYDEALEVYNQGLKIRPFEIELWRGKLNALSFLNKEEHKEERERVKEEIERMEENQKRNRNLW